MQILCMNHRAEHFPACPRRRCGLVRRFHRDAVDREILTEGPTIDVPDWMSKLAMSQFQNVLSATAYSIAQDPSSYQSFDTRLTEGRLSTILAVID